jgi:hypothetical protein
VKKPIFNNREIIGSASTIEGAKRVILANVNYPNSAFSLHVWERPKHIQEILDLPAGFVYSWSYQGADHA